MRSLSSALALLCLSVGLISAQLPKQFRPRVVAPPYMEQNLCSYMNVPGLPYNLYPCTTPYEQEYCGVTSKNKFDCCPGFERSTYTNDTCGGVLSVWKSMGARSEENVGSLLSESLNKNKVVDVYDKTINGKTYSMFVPYDDKVLKTANYDVTKSADNPNPVFASVTVGRAYSSNFKNGQTFQSVYNDQKNKLTIYSNGLMFLECAAFIRPDLDAANGVLHIVDSMIMPHKTSAFDRTTLKKALASIPEASAFMADLPADVATLLDNADAKWMTLFVPTNDAWNAAKAKYAKTPEDTATLVRNHVLKKMICSRSVTRKTERLGKTLAGESIGADCPAGGDFKRFFLDGCNNQVGIKTPDIMAGNGVIQLVEAVFVPLALRDNTDILTCLGTRFPISRTVTEMSKCDLLMKGDTRYIWLIPTNPAYAWWENYKRFAEQYQKFQTDADYRCNVYRYHVLQLKAEYAGLPPLWWNQLAFPTNYNPGRITWQTNYFVKYRYGSELYFHYARVINRIAYKFKYGYVYLIDRVNVLPEVTIMQYLQSRKDLSKSYQISVTGNVEKYINRKAPHMLYIVARNQGWQYRDELEWDGHRLINFLKLHMVKLYLWGDDIGYFHRETYHTYRSAIHYGAQRVYFNLRFKRALDGNMYIGYDSMPFDEWALVLEWNWWCYDGIVWIIDWPMACPEHVCADLKAVTVPDIDVYIVYATACRDDTGLPSLQEFSKDAYKIGRANPEKCNVFKIPPIEVYRLYDASLLDEPKAGSLLI